jgi:hypothetical protein
MLITQVLPFISSTKIILSVLTISMTGGVKSSTPVVLVGLQKVNENNKSNTLVTKSELVISD